MLRIFVKKRPLARKLDDADDQNNALVVTSATTHQVGASAMSARDDFSRDNASTSHSEDGDAEATTGVDGKKETDDSARYLKRLLAEGHERAEETYARSAYSRSIFLYVSIRGSTRVARRGCAMAAFLRRASEAFTTAARSAGRASRKVMHPPSQ